jgi:hypothetical protein
MAYEKKVSRKSPGLIMLLLDDSPSMQDFMPGTSDPKFVWTQRYSGVILRELLSRSVDAVGKDAVVKPRYFLSVLPYGGQVQPWGDEIMDIGSVVEKYTKDGNSLGLGGKINATDSANAFNAGRAVLEKAIVDPRFKDSFSPILFHLTDGQSQTDASAVAEQIKQLATADGNVLVVNAYIGTETSLAYNGPEDFPGYVQPSEAGPLEDNVRMFNMSSEVPETIRGFLVQEGIFPALREHSRLFFDVRTREMLKHCIQVVSSINANDVTR